MLLTSLKRMKFTLNIQGTSNDAKLTQLISTVSKRIEHYCKRAFKKMSYTQDFNPTPGQMVFRPKAYPIESITSLYSDPSGNYSGSQALIDSSSYLISDDQRTFIIKQITPSNHIHITEYGYSFAFPKSIRATYIGGLADHAVNEELTVSGGSGTITVSTLTSAVGEDSGAVAYVKTYTSAATEELVLENLYGEFEPGETITIGAATRVIVSKDNTILANDSIDLVTACELQVRYMWKNYDSFEMGSVSKDGQTSILKPSDKNVDYTFLTEVRDLLERFCNKVLDNPMES